MLVADFARELDRGTSPDKMLALAHENRDVRALNASIREAIKERGGLKDARSYTLTDENGKTHKIELAKGDRVVFERNDARTGVKNGSFATIETADVRGFTVRMDGEKGWRVRVENGDKQQLSHGYASSIHKSQGATVDRTFVLASNGMDSKLTYVSLSRQREDVKLYGNHTEFKTGEHLKNTLSRDGGREAFRAARDAGEGKEQPRQERQAERGQQAERGGGKEQAQQVERGQQADKGRGAEKSQRDAGKDRGGFWL